VALVARVVHARHHLGHRVALAGDLADHDVVLVVAGGGHDDRRWAPDAGLLQHEQLGAVAEQRPVGELALDPLEAAAVLLDHHHLVAEVVERAREVGAHLPAAHHQHEHQPSPPVERAHTSSASIAVLIGEITVNPWSE
jgi:hypothetical protein